MAKKKKSSIPGESLDFAALTKAGEGLFEIIDPVDYWIDTGNLALNYICSGRMVGGGIAGGRVTEIMGNSSTGKTLFGVNILAGTQRMGGIPVLLDSENAFNPEFAVQISKLDPDRMFSITSDTLEGCFNKIYAAIRLLRTKTPLEVPICILYDSIAASPSDREFAETTVDMDRSTQTAIQTAGAGKDKPGDRAKTCSKHFRNLPKFMRENNAALVVINQFRTKIGVMFGNPDTGAGGGRALEYYASTRLTLKAAKKTQDKYEVVNGVNLNIECVKNKVSRPFLRARALQLLFEKGVDPFGGLLDILIQTERVKGDRGNYQVLEPYAGAEEVKFRASKDRNTVPAEVLLKCPKIVDAESKEQVQSYIDLYGSAMEAIQEEVAKEEDIKLGEE
jgi:protein RecA